MFMPSFTLLCLFCSLLRRDEVYSANNKDNLLVLLRQVSREDLPSVLSQEFLEDSGEGDHWLPGAQLGALHHALLVINEKVSAAGQHRSALFCPRLGWALCTEVCHEPVNQFTQVPADAQKVKPAQVNATHRGTRTHGKGLKKGLSELNGI